MRVKFHNASPARVAAEITITLGSRTFLSYNPATIRASPKNKLTQPQLLCAATTKPPRSKLRVPHTMLPLPLERSFLSKRQKDAAIVNCSTRCGSLAISSFYKTTSGSFALEILEHTGGHLHHIAVIGNRTVRRQLVHESRQYLGDGGTGGVGRNSSLGRERFHLIAAQNLMNLIGSDRRIRPITDPGGD